MEENEKPELELYKIAIKGYQKHWEHYNHWMNMYAIFNGALFVGLYSIMRKEQDDYLILFQLCICILGCISSWFWLFSARGFYRWLVSWINVVKKHEKHFIKNLDNDFLNEKLYVYNLFMKLETDKCFKTRPFSTQKLTQWFAGSVAAIWTIMTAFFYMNNYENIGILSLILSLTILITVIVAGAFWTGRESDLSETHEVL